MAIGSDQLPVRPTRKREDDMDVPFTAEQTWFLHEVYPQMLDPDRFAVLEFYRLPVGIGADAVDDVVAELWETHSGLRVEIRHGDRGWTQRLSDTAPPAPLRRIDIRSLDEADREPAAVEIAAELRGGLSIAAGRLIRFVHFDAGTDNPGYLFVVLHHLLGDYASLTVLERHCSRALASRLAGKGRVRVKAAPFEQCTRILNDHANSDELADEFRYWSGLDWDGLATLPQRPGRRPEEVIREQTMRSVVGGATAERLVYRLPEQLGITAENLVLAALSAAVTGPAGGDFCVTVVRNGRSSAGRVIPDEHGGPPTSRSLLPLRAWGTVGWFATMGAIVMPGRGTDGVAEYLKRVDESVRAIPNAGANYGILRWLRDPARGDGGSMAPAHPQVHFNYFGIESPDDTQDSLLHRVPLPDSRSTFTVFPRPQALAVMARVSDGNLELDWLFDQYLPYDTVAGIAARCEEALVEFAGLAEPS
ncbi:MAG: condensation domain-containing protein [Actinocatenispora sp.]